MPPRKKNSTPVGPAKPPAPAIAEAASVPKPPDRLAVARALVRHLATGGREPALTPEMQAFYRECMAGKEG